MKFPSLRKKHGSKASKGGEKKGIQDENTSIGNVGIQSKHCDVILPKENYAFASSDNTVNTDYSCSSASTTSLKLLRFDESTIGGDEDKSYIKEIDVNQSFPYKRNPKASEQYLQVLKKIAEETDSARPRNLSSYAVESIKKPTDSNRKQKAMHEKGKDPKVYDLNYFISNKEIAEKKSEKKVGVISVYLKEILQCNVPNNSYSCEDDRSYGSDNESREYRYDDRDLKIIQTTSTTDTEGTEDGDTVFTYDEPMFPNAEKIALAIDNSIGLAFNRLRSIPDMLIEEESVDSRSIYTSDSEGQMDGADTFDCESLIDQLNTTSSGVQFDNSIIGTINQSLNEAKRKQQPPSRATAASKEWKPSCNRPQDELSVVTEDHTVPSIGNTQVTEEFTVETYGSTHSTETNSDVAHELAKKGAKDRYVARQARDRYAMRYGAVVKNIF